jgi:predicted ATPase
MPVRMRSLRIEGFKAHHDLTLRWHDRVNLITGPNNSGKTTVLEALALWVEIFDKITQQAGKGNTKRGISRGDWYLDTSYAHHSQILSVRSPGFSDLFHRDGDALSLTATFSEENNSTFAIPLLIRKARGGNYELNTSLSAAGAADVNKRLNTALTKWPGPFRVLFASPIAAVRTHEEFLTPGKVQDMLRQRRSAEVQRNRLFHLHYVRPNDFQRFREDLSQILTGEPSKIDFQIQGDPNKDVHVRVSARSDPRDLFRDISLLGSGSLQVIEVLLSLYLDPKDLDIILLDEPDSHIHRDIQQRLLTTIEQRATHAQVFATTHNEALLRATPWDRVFHLPTVNDQPHDLKPIGDAKLALTGRHHGLIASPLHSVLTSVGAETALDLLNALEARHFLLVEGPRDAALLDHLLDLNRMAAPKESARYWSLGGVESGLRALSALKAVLENIRNGRSLWDKAHLILDRDLLTEDHANALVGALHAKFKVRVTFWRARTVESVLLSGGPSRTLARILGNVAVSSGLLDRHPAATLAESACQRAWHALKDRLLARWGDGLDINHLHGQLKQRSDLLAELLDPKHNPLSRDLGKLQNDVKNFHQSASRSERLADSADKHDVRAFVAECFVHMGIDEERVKQWVDGPNWFQMLITELRDLQDFPALQTVLVALRGS